METTTIEVVQTTRDLLDIFVAAATIATGIALVVLTGLALALQMTRYLNETEPDLRFRESERDVGIPKASYGSFRIWFDIVNRSGHRASNLRWDSVSLSVMGEKPTVEADGIDWDFPVEESWPLEVDSSPPDSLLPGSSQHALLIFRTGKAPINGQYFLSVILGYSKRRALLRLIRIGNRRFRRTADYRWTWRDGEVLPGSIHFGHE